MGGGGGGGGEGVESFNVIILLITPACAHLSAGFRKCLLS